MLFDVYHGDSVGVGKKSLAFSLVFSDSNRTLTDDEVTACFNKIIDDVLKKHEAVLRDC